MFDSSGIVRLIQGVVATPAVMGRKRLLMQPLTRQTALFIAGLSDFYRPIPDAIEAHVFVQRVAPLPIDEADSAIATAVELGFAQKDGHERARLAPEWAAKRDQLEESEGICCVAESELSDLLLAHQSQFRGI
jgi:hypothetical protein